MVHGARLAAVGSERERVQAFGLAQLIQRVQVGPHVVTCDTVCVGARVCMNVYVYVYVSVCVCVRVRVCARERELVCMRKDTDRQMS